MKSTQIYDFAIPAGQSRQLQASGSFFRVMTATGLLEVIGDTFGSLYPLDVGQGLRGQEYTSLTLKNRSGSTITGTILVTDGEFIDTKLTGSVAVTNNGGVFSMSAFSLTTASVVLLAENLNRRYLLVQNNSASNALYVRLDGQAATATSGLRIASGGSLEIFNYVPTSAITGFGSSLGTAVIVSEG